MSTLGLSVCSEGHPRQSQQITYGVSFIWLSFVLPCYADYTTLCVCTCKQLQYLTLFLK